MSGIFVSYRKQDLGAGVDRLVHVLKEHFGEDEVYLDRESFIGGQEWAFHNRVLLARAMVILCVIGPAWSLRDENLSGPDYLEQELKLARELKKKVIPLYVGQAETESINSIPQKFAWLRNIQCIDGRLINGSNQAVISAIEQSIGHEGEKSRLPKWLSAAIRLFESLWNPMGIGAYSTTPNVRTTELVLRQCALGFVLMYLFISMKWGFDIRDLAGWLAAFVITGFGIIGTVLLLTLMMRASAPILSQINFSLQFLSTLYLLGSLIVLCVFLIMPDELGEKLVANSAGAELSESLARIFAELGEKHPLRATGFLIFEVTFGCLGLWIWWGYIKAGAIGLAWRWLPLAFLISLILGVPYISGTVYLLQDYFSSGTASTRDFNLVAGQDYVTPSESRSHQIVILGKAKKEVVNGNVRVKIEQMQIKNRTNAEFSGQLHGWLLTFTNGRWVLPVPSHGSDKIDLQKVPPYGEHQVHDIEFTIPLSSTYRSGLTSLVLYVNDIQINQAETLFWE